MCLHGLKVVDGGEFEGLLGNFNGGFLEVREEEVDNGLRVFIWRGNKEEVGAVV